MQISIMLNQQQNGPRQCNGTIGGNLQDSENEENVSYLYLQFQNSTPVIESEQFSNARRNKNTSVHELTRTFSQLICPPASHASLGNWRLKSNTWINKKKVARVSIYLDIRCYGGKGSHTVYVTFLYWDESALYENIWEIRRNYKRYL